MLTAYGAALDRHAPLTEYPRPQMVRQSYLSLNGPWEFAGAPRDALPQRFGGEIVVPFPPESELSGVGRPTPKGYALWYRRSFVLPEGFHEGRVLLHFDGADQIAEVWCNDTPAVTHAGGYTGFTADITALLQEENVLLVKVEDAGDEGVCAFGSQQRHCAWSGLWQSVWCESVPDQYIASLQLTPRLSEAALELTVFPGGSAVDGSACTAVVEGVAYELTAGTAFVLPVPNSRPWSPEEPNLYSLEVTLGEDSVQAYYAMREFTVEQDDRGRARFFLNGQPYFVSGVLYEGCWPDGLGTAPSDEALCADVEAAKTLGFNTIRLHDKVECARFYWHCDRLGIMVWQGMPTGGRDKPPAFRAKDNQYGLYGRKDPESRQQHRREVRECIQQLINAPCVVLWELFDEGRGLFDAENLLRFVRELDVSRPVDAVSGVDASIGDVRSVHSLHKNPAFAPDRAGRAVVFSAVGGFAHEPNGHLWTHRIKAKNIIDSPQGLLFAVEALYEDSVVPAMRSGLAGCIYSQLTDVEGDISGLISYDRQIFKIPARQARPVFHLRY